MIYFSCGFYPGPSHPLKKSLKTKVDASHIEVVHGMLPNCYNTIHPLHQALNDAMPSIHRRREDVEDREAIKANPCSGARDLPPLVNNRSLKFERPSVMYAVGSMRLNDFMEIILCNGFPM